MDRGAWRATVHGVTKTWTRLSTHVPFYLILLSSSYKTERQRPLLSYLRTSGHLWWSCVYSRRRQWQPTPVLLPGKSHGRRSPVGCSPWGREESDTTGRLHFHVSLSCIGEGNGNPLQCSCLENPRDRWAWWAAISGVAQSRTRLKRLSSSSSSSSSVYSRLSFTLFWRCSWCWQWQEVWGMGWAPQAKYLWFRQQSPSPTPESVHSFWQHLVMNYDSIHIDWGLVDRTQCSRKVRLHVHESVTHV